MHGLGFLGSMLTTHGIGVGSRMYGLISMSDLCGLGYRSDLVGSIDAEQSTEHGCYADTKDDTVWESSGGKLADCSSTACLARNTASLSPKYKTLNTKLSAPC